MARRRSQYWSARCKFSLNRGGTRHRKLKLIMRGDRVKCEGIAVMGVEKLHGKRSFRRDDDSSITYRHRRQTCSGLHHPRRRRAFQACPSSSRHQLSISTSSSSGRLLMVTRSSRGPISEEINEYRRQRTHHSPRKFPVGQGMTCGQKAKCERSRIY